VSIDLFKELCNLGHRIFTSKEAFIAASNIKIKKSYVIEALHHLKNKEFIFQIKNGLYAINQQFLPGPPLHEYEIGMHLANPSAICCFSAMQYHHITDQTSRVIYLMTRWGEEQSKLSIYRYQISGIKYYFIRSKPELYFGITEEWIGETSFMITDLERTLVDGLVRPKHCGGMREVISAFTLAQDKLDIEKIITYAKKFGVTICKRLGFILEQLNIESNLLAELKNMKLRGFAKLDPSGARSGRCNNEWKILENI